jgi:arylsulfatase A-like enzyme
MNVARSLLLLALVAVGTPPRAPAAAARPHVVFLMADDMGWGQTGFRGHPVLKTPHLDAMAAHGLRFERFYAANPVCSPTRASVLTGRTNDRTGVLSHGHALRLQERTLAQALRAAGYVTGHFGKWHLDGFRGPGAPVLAADPRSPAAFGFDEFVSATNFIDQDPWLGRDGVPEPFSGDSSEVIMTEAIRFLDRHRASGKPLFAVVWFGSPHAPSRALEADAAPFLTAGLDPESAHHHGELVALDRSVGTLRAKLREFGLAEDTFLFFCSDNGGLPGIRPATTGGLRGHKGSVSEGGLRVPGILEWPAVVRPRITRHPASTMDLFPTVADIAGLPDTAFVPPVDGISLKPLLHEETGPRATPIGFRHGAKTAWIEDRFKLVAEDRAAGPFELYDLEADPGETRDLAAEDPARLAAMKARWATWNAGVDASAAGRDYPERTVSPPDPKPASWWETDLYRPWIPRWKDHWAYRKSLARAQPSPP